MNFHPQPEFFYWYRVLAAANLTLLSMLWVFFRRSAAFAKMPKWEKAFWSKLVSPAWADRIERVAIRFNFPKCCGMLALVFAVVGLLATGFFAACLLWFRW
jgi:hypothetical protein